MKFSIDKDTQILATAGPTLKTIKDIEKAIFMGVNNFRLHLGSRDRDVKEYIENIRKAEKLTGSNVDVLLDLPSSRPRISSISYRNLIVDKEYIITDAEILDDNNIIPIPGIRKLFPHLKVGERVQFRDGKVTLIIMDINISEGQLVTKCLASNVKIGKGSSCVLPDSNVTYDVIVDEDLEVFSRLKESNLFPEWICISFANNKNQILTMRHICNDYWPNREIKLVAKIETAKGIKNIDEILEVTDGIMIGRGDLALHTDPSIVPLLQSYLIKKTQLAEKLCIVGTEFFECFANSGVANRAEVSDIANTVRENVDAIMLSMETANSKHPFESIALIKKIIEIEKNSDVYLDEFLND
ncbi:pyruvate kinase [Lysinibacillus sp. FSL M8-0134]|uniref:pyruvate kinase n=1 Tax=Lysinibacillus sp. FSL M8-0134 TaxID=2921717 RepID=UPI00311A406C